jgi:hypothetical protein
MASTIVQPATGRQEQKFLLLAVIAVLFVCAALIGQRRAESKVQRLQSYQISAFSGLTPGEQALFNDLYAAGLEVQSVHQDGGHWLTLDELRAQGIPPFDAKGFSWQTGGLDTVNAPAVAYFGASANPGTMRSFLLVLRGQDPSGERPHVHIDVLGVGPQHKLVFNANIWVSDASKPAMPLEFDPDTLGSQGWRQAVAFKGQDAQSGTQAAGTKP